MKKSKRKLIIRITAACAAVIFATPFLTYAKESTKAVQQIHHVHIGSPSEGGACYETEIKHVHDGDEEKGGSCYLSPAYHVHDGDEKGGGECYQTEIHHSHEGTDKDGKGCYGLPIYHAHTGSASAKGGCYGTPIYHKHTGSAGAGGGCYGKPVYHAHTGSSASKGGCYGKAVYHAHSGSAAAGDGCYRKAVYHSHDGNETSGGKCYAPVKHQHVSSCYEDAECSLKYVGNMQRQREENGYCYHHGETNVVHFRANYQHMSCGAGVEELGHSTCWTCQSFDFSHTYNRVICGKNESTVEGYRRVCGKETSTVEAWELGCGKNGSTIEKYELNCGKNGSTVDSYQRNCNKNESSVDAYQLSCNKTESYIESYSLNCGKTEENIDAYEMSCTKNEETIDSYGLSCEKTGETVDSYALSCPKDEKSGYASFSVSNQDSRWTSSDVALQASVQDENEFLKLSENPFWWEGNGINHVAASEVRVKENGIYSVHLKTENEDVDEKELVVSIEVKNIDRTAPSIEEIDYSKKEGEKVKMIRVRAKDLQPDGSPGSGMDSRAYSFDGGKTWQKDNTWEVKKNGIISVAVRDCCGNVSVQDIEILDAEEDKEDSNASGKEDKDNGNKGEENEENGNKENENNENENKENEDKENEDKENEDKGNGSDDNGYAKDEGEKENTGNGQENNNQENSQESKNVEDGQGNEKSDSGQKNEITGEDTKSVKEKKLKEKQNVEEKTEKHKVILPEKKERYQKESIQSEMPKNASEPENDGRSIRTLRGEAVEKTVKAVTFTISSIMLASGLIYLIYLMFRSIQVFDCDGEGKIRYVGSCIMKKTEEGFEVRLPNMIWEHSATGQYSLRPGRIFAKKHKGKELLVLAGERREAVWIDTEIPLRLTAHV